MVRMRLTAAGKIFLALMFLFYAASVTSQSGLLLLFIGLTGGCFAVNWSFARRNVKHLQVLPPKNSVVVEGTALLQPWRIQNPSRKHIEIVEVRSAAGVLFGLPMVKAGETLHLPAQLVYERRGVYPHTAVTIHSSAPFGLITAVRALPLTGEVVVLPKIYDAEAPPVKGIETLSGGKQRGNRRVHSGTHFAGVRGWQPGDSLRQVHWKSTARRDELMVKTFEEELGGRVTILLDAEGSEEFIDQAVRAAGSLGAASLQEGHHVELAAGREVLRMAPFSDEGEMLEELARYTPEERPRTIRNLWSNSTLVWVGTKWKNEWLPEILEARGQNRPVVVCLPEKSSIPEQIDVQLMWFGAAELWAANDHAPARFQAP